MPNLLVSATTRYDPKGLNKAKKHITGFEKTIKDLGKTLGPAFGDIFKVIKNDLLPILVKWWDFLYKEVIPAIGSIVGPILEGLKSAFDKIKKAITDNSTELQPFYDALAKVWDFIKKYLAPLLGSTFKSALETIGTLVGGLVTGFSKLVGFIDKTFTAISKFVNYVKDNPITRFFFGDSNDKSLKAGGGFDPNPSTGGFGGSTFDFGMDETPTVYGGKDPRTFTGAPLEAYTPGMQAAILRKNALAAETERLRQARDQRAATRSAATGGLSTSERIVINFNGITTDPEGTARTLVDTLNNSYYRGTNGAGNLVTP